MNFVKHWVFMTLILFLILAPVSPMRVQAQVDVTPEPTPVVVPVEVQPVVDPVQEPNTGNVTLPVWQLIAFIVGGFLSGGAVGVVGVGAAAKSILSNPAALKNAESVGNSVPQETANKLIDLADSAIAIATLTKEALDHIPAETKAQPGGGAVG